MIEVLFEDEYCMIVSKPNHVLVHHSYYARNIKDDSLLQILRKQFPTQNFYPVHRLDRKTSGALLLVKHKDFAKPFQDLFNQKVIQKTYYALVRGFSEAEGKIDTPIKNPDTGIYKDALTYYKKISQIELPIPVKPYDTSRYCILELQPKTGRTHQIRKHLNKIAHPIIGDHKYGNRHHNQMIEKNFGLDYLFLHAFALTFIHPYTEDNINVQCPIPLFWTNFFKKTNWINELI